MLSVILFVLTVLSVIWTWRLINFGVRSANRIALATETSAAALQTICDSMSDEAKQRANEARLAREARVQTLVSAAKVQQQRDNKTAVAVVGAVMAFFAVMALVGMFAH